MIHLITGGERSGKSSYAQKLALVLSDSPYYLATSRVLDADFQKRIDRHVSDRSDQWTTIEEDKFIGNLNIEEKVVVLDCITLWLTNWFFDLNKEPEIVLEKCKAELAKLFQQREKYTLYIITNEIGMGGHGATPLIRKFTELQGWVNQLIAKEADQVTLMVSGLPMKVK